MNKYFNVKYINESKDNKGYEALIQIPVGGYYIRVLSREYGYRIVVENGEYSFADEILPFKEIAPKKILIIRPSKVDFRDQVEVMIKDEDDLLIEFKHEEGLGFIIDVWQNEEVIYTTCIWNDDLDENWAENPDTEGFVE